MSHKKSSSKEWLKRHFTDPYVKEAHQKGFRARAVFKLIEIQERYHILKSGMSVIDLGAAPGSWAQYASRCVGKRGTLLAVDLLPMEPLNDVVFIQGDFTEDAVVEQIISKGETTKFDCVLSDIAPNMSGIRAVDQSRMMFVVDRVFEFACQNLAENGSFVCKLFQGEGFDLFMKECRRYFKKMVIFKPNSSRPDSREVYCVAKQFKFLPQSSIISD
jgi:23S rRNA (uridine2552-2'-O)-methyltransferase